MKYRMGPGSRLQVGAAILAAARVMDTAPIKSRLLAFLTAHRNYVSAQDNVEAANAQLRAAQAKVARRERGAEEAVEALALTLAVDGHARTKPFAAFGAITPSAVKHLTGSEKAGAIQQLVAAVQGAKTVSQKTRDAARAVEQAGRAFTNALVPIEELVASLREVRRQRDTIGQKWDTTLAALRRETRSAADDGAPGLYPALFATARVRKRAAAVPGSPVAPASPAAPPLSPADTPAVVT